MPPLKRDLQSIASLRELSSESLRTFSGLPTQRVPSPASEKGTGVERGIGHRTLAGGQFRSTTGRESQLCNSAHTHEDCDNVGRRPVHIALEISIHAPAKGATPESHPLYPLPGISIHAPAKGATRVRLLVHWDAVQFQSTHPRRVRPSAPTNWTRSRNFNPRTREGCDGDPLYDVQAAIRFQSTHPRRVRHRRSRSPSGEAGDFNPRTREGCDKA